jgi:cytochrome c peroxidase
MPWIALLLLIPNACSVDEWSAAERANMRSLWIEALPPLPPDPSNAVADDPAAARLGQALYFDPRFSADGQVSCASCHQPARAFADGKPRSEGQGLTLRHAPSILGSAYSPWFFWDGRSDSQWSQALGPLETATEHGGDRLAYAHRIADAYAEDYVAIFGPLPDLEEASRFPARAGPVDDPVAKAAWQAMAPADREAVSRVFANMGKSIAAYERHILPGPSRFDRYVAALESGDLAEAKDSLSPDERLGLRLFLGAGRCLECHNGPRFTNDSFHNIGLPLLTSQVQPDGSLRKLSIEEAFDTGRAQGVIEAIDDPFNCLGAFSDATEADCAELRFAKTSGDTLAGAFKTPSLRNVAESAPYMHDGRFASLAEVLQHYQDAPLPVAGHSDLQPLRFDSSQLAALEAFLQSLSGAMADDPSWLAPPR